MMLDNLIGRGLQQEPTDAREIARYLAKIAIKIADSRAGPISLDSRFDIAYEAVLQSGLCALRANGLRPDSRGGHHILALQTLDSTIGFPKEKIRLIDTFRKQRGAGLYDGSFAPSEAELAALLAIAAELQAHLEQWLKANHPELLKP
jgi:hypothetical protein